MVMGDSPGNRRTPPARSGRPGIADVAAEAGVSPSTVSSALNGTRAVRPETRERVLRAAERLGYVPSKAPKAPKAPTASTAPKAPEASKAPDAPRAAREESPRPTRVIGVITDGIATTPFAGRIVQGAQEVARERGALLVVLDSDGDPELEAHHLRSLPEHGVDGVLYTRTVHAEVARPRELGDLPVVLVGAAPADGWTVPAVVPDEYALASAAVAHLLEVGHRRFAFLTSDEDTPATRGRADGFASALAPAWYDGARSVVERAAPDAAGGRRVARRLLHLPVGERPTAIVCFNDQMAMGVYQGAEALGLEVPRDASVLGIGDLELLTESLDPPLSTMALPHREMGRWGMTALLALLEGRAADAAEPVQLAGELVERRSVARPRRLIPWLTGR
jgi:LacI family transcriptional regulator